MDTNDMATALLAHKQRDGHTAKIYKAEADKLRTEAIRTDIGNHVDQLRTAAKGKVDLNDLEDVKQRTFAYLEACAQTATFPSVMGLAAVGFGISRRTLNKYIANHPESASAEFLLEAKDVFADTLTNAALQRNADAASVIFQLKNHYDHADTIQVSPVVDGNPLGMDPDQRALEDRIMGSVVVDDD